MIKAVRLTDSFGPPYLNFHDRVEIEGGALLSVTMPPDKGQEATEVKSLEPWILQDSSISFLQRSVVREKMASWHWDSMMWQLPIKRRVP